MSCARRSAATSAIAGPSGCAAVPCNRVEARGKHLLLHFDGDLVDALAPADDRRVGGLRRGRALAALAAARVARDACAGARGRAVRRPAARADDAGAHAQRRAPGRARAGHPRGAFRRARAALDGSARTIRRARSATRSPISARSPGIGNIWKSESCFAASLDPWKRLSQAADAEILAAVRHAREHMAQSARDGFLARPSAVYGRAGEACPRCGDADPLRRAGRAEPHDLLVPAMPALIRVGHRGAPAVAPDNTIASFDAALAIGVDMIEFDVLPARGGLARALRRPRLRRARPVALADADGGARALRDGALRGDPPPARHQAPRRRAAGARRRSTPAGRARARSSAPALRGVLPRFRELAPDIPRGWTVPDIPVIGDPRRGSAACTPRRIPARAGAAHPRGRRSTRSSRTARS